MRNERAFLFDMLDSAQMALGYVCGRAFEDFQSNPMMQDAVLRRLEIIGEAAKQISEKTRAQLPQLPFDEMARMRNRITHVYWRVDLRIVWDTVVRDLPPLIAALESLGAGDDQKKMGDPSP